jgi:acetyl/propionyl-CoA carboxylase alpha subunit
VIRGPGHNIPFLAAVLANPRFAEARLTTNFIAEEYGERFQGVRLDALPAARPRRRRGRDARPEEARAARIGGRLPGWVYKPTTEWRVEFGRRNARRDPRSDPAGRGRHPGDDRGRRGTASTSRSTAGARAGSLVRARVGGRPSSSRRTRSPRAGC